MTNENTNNLEVGSSLGHYRILKKIGAGGMGEIFLAEDEKLERRVALKILPADLAKDTERMRRFVLEAKSASALNQPNIITIYEIGESDGTNYIAAEFIEGETLSRKINSESLELKDALQIAVQIASALDAAHSAGIVHRDIKPDNVMIRPDGLVKILDFGIAKLTEKKPEAFDAEAATAIKAGTISGMIIGTASYMSPEQAAGKTVDARSDVFSLGIVLYEMIAGRQPFAGDTVIEIIGLILHKEPALLSESAVPRELRRITEKCLRKERDERYQTAKDLLVDLKEVKQDLEFHSKSERNKFGVSSSDGNLENKETQILEASTTAKTEPPESETPNIKRSFVVALVLLLAVAGFGIWYFTGHSTNTKQIESIAVNSPKIPQLYWQMTEAEQLIFIRERAHHIQTLIGDEPTEFDEEELRAIKAKIDHYVERKDSLAQKPFEEGMRVIYGRASQYAPLVIRAYEARQVPPALGLYQAMIESEYHDCLIVETGNVGLFQFAPKTAAIYGLKPKDYCDVEKQSDAAARYMSNMTSDFGDGKSSATLGLLGFVIGEDKPRDYLRQLRGRGITERSFWAIFRYRENLQPPLSEDGKRYVPQFFAAAIIGETPEAFELSTPPLTTLREKGK